MVIFVDCGIFCSAHEIITNFYYEYISHELKTGDCVTLIPSLLHVLVHWIDNGRRLGRGRGRKSHMHFEKCQTAAGVGKHIAMFSFTREAKEEEI